MKTEKHHDHFLLTWLVLSDSKFSEEAICIVRWLQIDYCKANSVSNFTLQYDGDVNECAGTNYNSNGIFTVDLQHCVEYSSRQENGRI